MISYYDIIKNLFTVEEFDRLLAGKPLEWDWKEKIDISPGSGFHMRERKRKVKP